MGNDITMGDGDPGGRVLQRRLLFKQVIKNSVKRDASALGENAASNEGVEMDDIYALDLVYGGEELDQMWTIELDQALQGLSENNPEGFGREELRLGREDELGRIHRCSVWSKFRIGLRKLGGSTGGISSGTSGAGLLGNNSTSGPSKDCLPRWRILLDCTTLCLTLHPTRDCVC